jgi:GxGYxYP putative glycoside hydrolase C-terminal domain
MRQIDVAVPRPVAAPRPLAQYAAGLWAQILDAQPAIALRFLCYLGGLAGFNVVPSLQGAGRVPLSWTISPGLVDAAPGLLRWSWRTATRNDEIVAGVSGLGYVRPDQVPCSAYSAFTQRTSTYLSAAGLTVVHLLDSSNTLLACAARAYSNDIAALLGLVQSVNSPQAPTLLGGRYAAMLYVTMDGFQTSAGALVSAVQRGAAGWDGRSPRFIAVSGLAWDLMPGDFLSAMNTLRGQSTQYVFVRDDQLMMLMRQAHRLPRRHINATVFPFDSGTDGFIAATSGKRDDHARWDGATGNPTGSLLLDGSDRGRTDSKPNAWFSQTPTLPPHATTLTFDTRSLDGRHAAQSAAARPRAQPRSGSGCAPQGAWGPVTGAPGRCPRHVSHTLELGDVSQRHMGWTHGHAGSLCRTDGDTLL